MTAHTKRVVTRRKVINRERRTHEGLVIVVGIIAVLASWAASWVYALTDDPTMHLPAHATYQQVRHAQLEGLIK